MRPRVAQCFSTESARPTTSGGHKEYTGVMQVYRDMKDMYKRMDIQGYMGVSSVLVTLPRRLNISFRVECCLGSGG